MVSSGSSKDAPICIDDSDNEQVPQVKGKRKAEGAPTLAQRPLGVNMAALNQEREARQAKRMREAASSSSTGNIERSVHRPRVSQDAPAALPAWSQSDIRGAVSPITASNRFWDGTVKVRDEGDRDDKIYADVLRDCHSSARGTSTSAMA